MGTPHTCGLHVPLSASLPVPRPVSIASFPTALGLSPMSTYQGLKTLYWDVGRATKGAFGATAP
jgi:hypothetical protein